jgi:hypothetical protein
MRLGVVETVVAGLGERDLAVHPYAVADTHPREVERKDLDPAAPKHFPVLVPQVLDSHVGPVAVAGLHRRGRHLTHKDDLARLERRELGQRIGGGGVERGYPGATRDEDRRHHRHEPPFGGHEIPPQSRPYRDNNAPERQHRGERRDDRSGDYPRDKGDGPEVQPHRRAQVEVDG